MLRAEGEEDALVGRRRLQLEVERPAEALSEREAEGAVRTRAERRVHDELHPARLVEEALGDERPLRRDRPQHGAGGGEVVDELARAGLRDGAFLREPAHRRGAIVEAPLDLLAQRGHLVRQLAAPARRLRHPERDPGRRALRVLHADDPASMRRIRQEVFPSRNTSPAMLSTAKSSSTWPTGVPSGSATTVYCEVSGWRCRR